jgi:2-dehydro-3-deoxyphosphogluconate aldolase/(4S)-4-hydroxy-2-oxoglutarate aldolase
MSTDFCAGPIAILRAKHPLADPISIVKILRNSGLRWIEITLTTPLATVAMRTLADAGLAVGAGSVRTRDDAYRARDAGATFLVTPGLVEGAADAGLPVLMGAYTASEAMRACDLGAAAVKLFPASLLSPAYARALLAPLPDLRLVPTGGVVPATFAAWKAAGCVGVGIGSELRTEEADGLAERARACVAAWA